MLQNPLTDAIGALADTGFPKPAFWLLLLGCAIAAALVWRSEPTQHSIQDVGRCVLRVIVGTMWWQQSLWKVPPHYDWGLIHWMQEMVEHGSIQLQGELVRDIVLPNIAIFGPLVYAIEVAIARQLKVVKRGVVAGPCLDRPRRTEAFEKPHDVAIRIEHADGRDICGE
jgi:hypothetical protein